MIYIEEVWVDIQGYEGYYQISNFGRVRSLDRIIDHGSHKTFLKGKPVKQRIYGTITKYYGVNLHKNGKCKYLLVHHLIRKHFMDNQDKNLTINHIDGNSLNNHISNLELISLSENLLKKNDHTPRRKYTYYFKDIETGKTFSYLDAEIPAKQFNVSSATIRNYARKIWNGLFQNKYQITRVER